MLLGTVVTLYLLEFFILGIIMWLIGGFIGKFIKSMDDKKLDTLKKDLILEEELRSNFIDKRKTYTRIASLLMEDKYGTEWMFVELSKDDERLLDELRKEICK